MLTQESELIDVAIVRLLMTENLLNAISYRCWEDGNDVPTDVVASDVVTQMKSILEKCNHKLKEIETANQCTLTSIP